MKTALALIALSTVLAGASALKCYTCANCDKNAAEVKECSGAGGGLLGGALSASGLGDGHPICHKTVTGDLVVKGCSPIDLCSGEDELDMGAAGDNYCCKDDLCNSAGAPASALALLLSPALVALIR